jgi:glycosyltransferase involved in cell wall biosynthesis
MADGVLRYVPENKVSIIPNMAKIDLFWPRKRNKQIQIKLGIKSDSFKIIHFGSLGLANGVMSILKVAEKLKNDNYLEFVFIGGGSLEADLKEYCKEKNLRNVHFLGTFSLNETSEIVNLCDVSIVSFQDLPILYTNSPNKLFDSLSAGIPIIVNSAGWTKELVESNECGIYVNPNKPEQLVGAIKLLRENQDLKNRLGINSRLLAETKYDKSILCNKYAKLLKI